MLAEFIGSIFFMWVILASGNAFAIGAALAIAVFMVAGVSGGMFNPMAATVMLAHGKLKVSEYLPYVVAEVLGGLVALGIYKAVPAL